MQFRSAGGDAASLQHLRASGQSARAVIPTVLSQALSGAETIRLGNLDPKRDLTFVEDTARAFLLAAETPGIEGQTIHFGQGQAVTIGELAQRCLNVVGSKARLVSVSERQRPEKAKWASCSATLQKPARR